MCPLHQLNALVLRWVFGYEELVHLGNILLPNRNLLVNHRLVHLVHTLDEFAVNDVDHTCLKTLGSTMCVAQFQALGTFESSLNRVGNIHAVVIGIPRSTTLVPMTQRLVRIYLIAVNQHVESQRELAVRIVLILRSLGVGTLELNGTPDVLATDGCHLARTLSLHTILLLQLLDDILRQTLGIVVRGTALLDVQLFARSQILVGQQHHTPRIGFLGTNQFETGTQCRNLRTTMNLSHTGGIAVGILQHFANELHLDWFATHQQSGIFGGITTEAVL